jgi:hypothetical protein
VKPTKPSKSVKHKQADSTPKHWEGTDNQQSTPGNQMTINSPQTLLERKSIVVVTNINDSKTGPPNTVSPPDNSPGFAKQDIGHHF